MLYILNIQNDLIWQYPEFGRYFGKWSKELSFSQSIFFCCCCYFCFCYCCYCCFCCCVYLWCQGNQILLTQTSLGKPQATSVCAAIYLIPDGEKNRNFHIVVVLSLLRSFSANSVHFSMFHRILSLLLFVSSLSLWLVTFFHILHSHNVHVFPFWIRKTFHIPFCSGTWNSRFAAKIG